MKRLSYFAKKLRAAQRRVAEEAGRVDRRANAATLVRCVEALGVVVEKAASALEALDESSP